MEFLLQCLLAWYDIDLLTAQANNLSVSCLPGTVNSNNHSLCEVQVNGAIGYDIFVTNNGNKLKGTCFMVINFRIITWRTLSLNIKNNVTVYYYVMF